MEANYLVFARRALADIAGGDRPCLLLEGSWAKDSGSCCRSLDEAIGPDFAWIDKAAARLAEEVAEFGGIQPAGDRVESISPASLNQGGLRYHLLKLLRVVAFFTEVQPLRAPQRMRLVVATGRDECYAEILEAICHSTGVRLEVRWGRRPLARASSQPRNGLLRRLASHGSKWLEPLASQRRPRIVLCGNGNVLEPVCDELLAKNAQVFWLHDRFSWRRFARGWRRRVPQLACNASLGDRSRFVAGVLEPLRWHGVDLAPAVAAWLQRRLAEQGAWQTRLVEQIDAHFQRIQPALVVLDQDVTPLNRAAVEVARILGAQSVVVQHGAPCTRFGFAPLAADRVFAWGEASREQLLRWDVPDERIAVTGSPIADRIGSSNARKRARGRTGRHVLLLGTNPPRDDRPDLAAIQFNRQTYAEMLRVAFAALAKRPGVRCSLKLHPRAGADPILQRALAGFPGLRARIIRRGSAEALLGEADCVLHMGSTAGICAVAAGLPVIQVLPPGVDELLRWREWGQVGAAHTESELDGLLDRALAADYEVAAETIERVFAHGGRAAAERIADELLHLAAGDGRRQAETRRELVATYESR